MPQEEEEEEEEAVDLFSFTWSVPDQGYVWRDDVEADSYLGGTDPPPFLMVHPQFKEERRYAPLPFDEDGEEDEPLFQRFAALRPSVEEIKTFANTWGWLGVGDALTPSRSRKMKARVEKGESLEKWRGAIYAMRYAVTLWKWLTLKDWTVRVTWESESCVSVCVNLSRPKKKGASYERKEILIFRQFHPNIFLRFQRNDPTLPVRVALTLEINKKLNGIASPCILLDRRGQLKGFVRPHNLLAAMWVQLYQAVQGQRRILTCTYCGEIMDVTGSRRSKKAHSRCTHNAKISRYRKKLAVKAGMKKRRGGATAGSS